jgi:predicted kinase
VLVVLTGLPSTGKSAIADRLGRSLQWPVFSVDPLEAALLRGGVTREQFSDRIAYDLLEALALHQLMLRQSAILDAVNPFHWVRARWQGLAQRFSVACPLIECVCSDRQIHRDRLESRKRDIPGFAYEPGWDEVERQVGYYEAPNEEHLILDAVNPVEDNLRKANAYIGQFRS